MRSLRRLRLMVDHLSDIARRIERNQQLAGVEVDAHLEKDPWEPRWAIESGRWIVFECGCRGEITSTLVDPQEWDPIIFPGTAQQAVYDHVCDRHGAGMNKRLNFGRWIDFGQWKRHRRAVLMGRIRA
jgi:hypothetical protein